MFVGEGRRGGFFCSFIGVGDEVGSRDRGWIYLF